jgi:hypothetical protein
MHMTKAHIRLDLALENKNKLIQDHSAELKHQDVLERKQFMIECFKKDLGTLLQEAQEIMSLQGEIFLEDLQAEVAERRAWRLALENIAGRVPDGIGEKCAGGLQ